MMVLSIFFKKNYIYTLHVCNTQCCLEWMVQYKKFVCQTFSTQNVFNTHRHIIAHRIWRDIIFLMHFSQFWNYHLSEQSTFQHRWLRLWAACCRAQYLFIKLITYLVFMRIELKWNEMKCVMDRGMILIHSTVQPKSHFISNLTERKWER